MEILGYLAAVLLGAACTAVAMLVSRGSIGPKEQEQPEMTQSDREDMKVIRQWANLMRYDGTQQQEDDGE